MKRSKFCEVNEAGNPIVAFEVRIRTIVQANFSWIMKNLIWTFTKYFRANVVFHAFLRFYRHRFVIPIPDLYLERRSSADYYVLITTKLSRGCLKNLLPWVSDMHNVSPVRRKIENSHGYFFSRAWSVDQNPVVCCTNCRDNNLPFILFLKWISGKLMENIMEALLSNRSRNAIIVVAMKLLCSFETCCTAIEVHLNLVKVFCFLVSAEMSSLSETMYFILVLGLRRPRLHHRFFCTFTKTRT